MFLLIMTSSNVQIVIRKYENRTHYAVGSTLIAFNSKVSTKFIFEHDFKDKHTQITGCISQKKNLGGQVVKPESFVINNFSKRQLLLHFY